MIKHLALGWALLMVIGSLSIARTSLFVHPLSYEVRPEGQIFVREVPLGTVQVDWVMEATMPDGYECEPLVGISTIQKRSDNTVRLPIPAPLKDCVVPGSVVTVSYTMHIFGIPLWPLIVTDIVGD